MSLAGKMYVSELDRGLKELAAFIKAQKIGEQSTNRQLKTDKEYEFTVCTKKPRQANQAQAEIIRQVVKIPAGETLHFVGRTGKGMVDPTDFMVNDGPGAWRINTFTFAVKRREHNVHVRSAQTKQIFNTRLNGNGLSRP
jgi:hypothetical protein